MANQKTAQPLGDPFQDIPHEEISITKFSAEHQPPSKILTPEQTAEQEIKKFNLADSAIQILNEKYGSLVISGPEDKAGYKAVREAWGDVRSKRTGLEKKGKELRDGYNLISKKIIKEECRLIELLTPLETSLHEKWKSIDEEKERAEKEREAEENRVFMQRIEELQKFGMQLEGGFYSIGEAISLDAVTLRSLPEDQFTKLKTRAQAIFDQEQAEIKKREDERRREAEAYEIAKQELLAQQEVMKRLQEQVQRDREELEKQRKAAEAQVLETRVNKFLGLGMERVRNDLYFTTPYGEIDILVETLGEMPEENFETLFENITIEIKKIKDQQATQQAEREAEAKAREQKEKFIAEQMERAGLKYFYADKCFRYDETLFFHWPDLIDLSDEDIKSLSDDLKEQIEARKADNLRVKKELEAEEEKQRRLGMKDGELLQEFLNQITEIIQGISVTTFSTAKNKFKAEFLQSRLIGLLDDFKKQK